MGKARIKRAKIAYYWASGQIENGAVGSHGCELAAQQ